MINVTGVKAYEVSEIADMLKIDIDTVRRFMREGRLKGVKVGRKWYATEETLKTFLQGEGEEDIAA